MSGDTGALSALLTEERRFPPSAEFTSRALFSDPAIYDEAAADIEGYWAEWAKQLDWFEPWEEVLDWNPPVAKWFVGGKPNVSHNCLDRHLSGPGSDKVALIWVVFGGFSPESLADRNNDAQAHVLITADGGWRRGGIVPLKRNADEALETSPTVEHVIVVRRGGELSEKVDAPMKEGRDLWYHELMALVHRVRSARQRCHGPHVRGSARRAGSGAFLGNLPEIRRHRVLHGPDGHPGLHALG